MDKDQKKITAGCVAVVFFVLFLLFPAVWLINRYIVISLMDDQILYSENIQESQQKELFIGFYRPLEDSIVFDGTRYATEMIWCEKQWRSKHRIFGGTDYFTVPGMNVFVPCKGNYSIAMASDIVGKKESYAFTKQNDSIFVHSVSEHRDTLTLIFFSLDDRRDTILYVRESLLHRK